MDKYSSVKISDVSKLAGVSVATVSRVINNTCFVNPETKEKVLKAVEELAYEPNLSARNLRRNTSGAILVIAPNMTNPYYSNIIKGISETARKYDCSTFVCSTDGDKEQELELLKILDNRRADAAIILATNIDNDEILPYVKKYPVVFCSEYNPALNIDRVSIDNYQAAVEATEYLIGLGHRNVGMMSSENDYISTELRKQGFLDACKKHGIKNAEKNIVYASKDYSFSSARSLAKKIFSKKNHIDALFCISDILALGAIYGARECKLEVPEDVSILGFDNLEYSEMMVPQISTVNQPCYKLGEAAMERIQDKLNNPESEPKVEILKHRLVVRGSTSKI
ncbi:LacI family DNA-binding transcriptional regulator [Anaerorhabdus furcosa]|uniref:Transcriptional regulator, LacI family n=1 Tax=Anaerorhabdus furcosa TaxID=118967 RepID=A0A1T4MCE1_9FIRM|nr:LacI family DNA-binding transcriptional regulator [Anaerorhabdus furcosa]SJZ64545.1 transcriptional regulator, LacI family [Anaerorhabdus furcosa]